MFAEEEWTDSPSADGSSHTVKVSPAQCKDKTVGKKSLLRTLQTLGTVPKWELEKAIEDSDEEKITSPAVQTTKKKRCKKRKRRSNADNEGKQKDAVDFSETPMKKKQKLMKTAVKGTSSKVSQESRKDKNDKGVGPQFEENESQAETKLSRKQWKSKMKNKRRCKNKYLPKTTGVDDANAKKESLVQTPDIKESKKVQKQKSKKMTGVDNANAKKEPLVQTQDINGSKKVQKSKKTKNGISSTTDNVENGKDFKTDKTARIDHSLSNGNISHEVKPSKMTKKSQLQAEKLRRILKSGNKISIKATEEPEEPKDTRVKLKSDEEQMASDPSTVLRMKMVKQLEAARFRYINEQLYTSTSGEAKRMFQQDPEAIAIYHKGYTTQVQHWPTNPVDSIISYICSKPASLVVADFGCGDCKIARSVKNKVHSFDLAPVCDLATACDMAKVPLRDSTVDIAVFCLSLMGTNLGEFLAEANRVLVMGGVLKIAEVASRFENVRSFIGSLSSLGFKIVNKDTENSHFYAFEFTKTAKSPENVKKAGLQLKPCLYKKR